MKIRLDVELDNNETRHCEIDLNGKNASIIAYSVIGGNPLTFKNIDSIANLGILSENDLASHLQSYIQSFLAKAFEPGSQLKNLLKFAGLQRIDLRSELLAG